MHAVIFTVSSIIIILTLGVLGFCTGSILTVRGITLLLQGKNPEFEALLYAALAVIIGVVFTFLSLIPSYKLCLKLAKSLQSRGWEIKNPKRLFWISVGLLFLPIILLVLLGPLLQ
ncbi:MAG: hypothetical protein FJ044_03800 [Candidatus Cloacimonetes bacterium]|nr:hypothetical protein [Candidatus Cloacimonadota bacterium]